MWWFQGSADGSKALIFEHICDEFTVGNLQNTSYRGKKHTSIEKWGYNLIPHSFKVQ